jgi:hypothetical protein
MMVFPSFPTKLGRCYPDVCTAETGCQLLTATSYTIGLQCAVFSMQWC